MRSNYFLAIFGFILISALILPTCTLPFGSSSLPAINSFNASPASISAGGSAVIDWNVSNATTVIIDQGVGTVSTTGSVTVSPLVTTTYTLTAVNASGTNSKTAILTVSGSSSATTTTSTSGLPVIQYFTVAPTGITPRGTAILSWSVVGASSVVIDNGIGNVAPANTRSVSPNITTNYTLTAVNPAGMITQQVTLAVTPAAAQPAGATPGDKDFIGSKHTYEYHYSWCSIGQNIPMPSRIIFDTWQAAKAAGYHPCVVCKPPK